MSIKSGVLDFTIGMIKKVKHFNDVSASFLHHDVDTDVSLTYLSNLSINQQTVLLF